MIISNLFFISKCRILIVICLFVCLLVRVSFDLIVNITFFLPLNTSVFFYSSRFCVHTIQCIGSNVFFFFLLSFCMINNKIQLTDRLEGNTRDVAHKTKIEHFFEKKFF